MELNTYDCPICLDIMEKKCNLQTLKCNHTFHKECINLWLDRKPICPLCRMSVIDVFKCSGFKYRFIKYKIKLEFDRLCIKNMIKTRYIDFNKILRIAYLENVIIIYFNENNIEKLKKYVLPNEELCKNLFTSIKNNFIN